MSTKTPDPRQLPPDPRLRTPTTSSQDTVVAALVQLYENLPHIEPSHVHRAPSEGWPQITIESVAARGLRKTPEAVELLRHLPYIDGPKRCWIAPYAYPVDYRFVVSNAKGIPFVWELNKSDGEEDMFPPWVVQLTTGDDSGAENFMLDTMDGTVTKYVVTGPVYPDARGRYAKDDPRAWRDEWCDNWTKPVEQLAAEWQEKYRRMQFLGMPGNMYFPGVLNDPGERGGFMWNECEAMKRIYTEHGWPDSYRGDECRQALIHWWKNRE
ncbi:uncharacterized protein BCR38DRAFT_440149 [Pseudomassariella vexata]|uniref:Uncharacterized protein n=1 Tax=Pseudomassariella vexata TaxID=1141098 RepID=A0A1Y2DQ57_9PEZI|nr:uncharacterized protein BCR38DRAFT_440149 [Pseudomassariella vexata]ORY61422.1 hypothetical protein BCR38DRAFT_440149 [Pseudomassariella vexata]